MQGKQIDLAWLTSFVRANWLKFVLKGTLSLCAVGALLALYAAFAPRSERYTVEMQVTLEPSKGELVYPNGDTFGAHDIISAPVLNRVWKKYGLDAKKVKFEDFCRWFGIIGYDKKRAKVDAEFQGKMTKRNITVTELTALQNEYEERLAALSANRFVLSMRPEVALDRETAVKMMNDIPEIWFAEYARLKAPLVPSVASSESVRAYLTRVQADGSRVLELFDVLRCYVRDLLATCDYVRNRLLKGRNACVEGVDLGTYESQLDIFKTEMLRMKYKILTNVSSIEFEQYINVQLEDLACEQKKTEERIAAVSQTLDAFGGEGRRTAGTSAAEGGRQSGPAGVNPVTVQADSGFFADFAAMVRRDANQDFVRKYAEELTEYRKQLADISSRKLYYDQITKHIKASRADKAGGDRTAEVLKEITALAEDLLQTGEKVVAFRDASASIYRTSDQFYAIATPAAYGKSFVLSLPRFLIGLLAIWALVNLACLARDWNKSQL